MAKPELGKWLLWRHFARDTKTRVYLPATKPYSRSALQEWLNRYSMVYVKPVAGWGGKGVMCVRREGSRYSGQRERSTKTYFSTMNALARWLESWMQGRMFIVQQGIHLAHINGRPFDLRVMMQKGDKGQWVYTGMLAKVAGPNSVVTNIARGKGYVTTVEEALRRSIGASPARIRRIRDQIIALAREATRRMEEYQPYSVLGFDVGVDVNGKVWLIEENTGPSFPLFAKLSDKTMYRRLYSTLRAYRRYLANKRAGKHA